MTTAKVGRRGQITLPKAIRKSLKLKKGDRIAFVMKAGEIVLQPVTGTLMDHRGSIAVEGPQDFEAIRRETLSPRADGA